MRGVVENTHAGEVSKRAPFAGAARGVGFAGVVVDRQLPVEIAGPFIDDRQRVDDHAAGEQRGTQRRRLHADVRRRQSQSGQRHRYHRVVGIALLISRSAECADGVGGA